MRICIKKLQLFSGLKFLRKPEFALVIVPSEEIKLMVGVVMRMRALPRG
jgi:hypothetical protein